MDMLNTWVKNQKVLSQNIKLFKREIRELLNFKLFYFFTEAMNFNIC